MSKAHLHLMTADGQWVPARTDGAGFSGSSAGGGSVTLPSGAKSTVAPWSYAAASGGITGTSDVVLSAAAGIGRANYLTSLQIVNRHATVATEVVVKDGSTVIWRAGFPALGTVPAAITFDPPLVGTQNTALNAACITTGTATYINAQGYTDAALEVLAGQQTTDVELFDALGNGMVDGSGNALYVPHYVGT